MFTELANSISKMQSPVGFMDALVAIGFSLLASIVAFLMYRFFYGSRYLGAGVHRSFIIGGPAITALFLGIQTSIPLSLGLLGALSFVRFRTPVKDPAEIGFLLLLIASSIGAATGNYMVTTILFILVFVSLGIQWLAHNRFALAERGHLIISLDQPFWADLEEKLDSFLQGKLRGIRLETMSVIEDRVSLNYQYRRQTHFNWKGFTSELEALATPAKVEIFVG